MKSLNKFGMEMAALLVILLGCSIFVSVYIARGQLSGTPVKGYLITGDNLKVQEFTGDQGSNACGTLTDRSYTITQSDFTSAFLPAARVVLAFRFVTLQPKSGDVSYDSIRRLLIKSSCSDDHLTHVGTANNLAVVYFAVSQAYADAHFGSATVTEVLRAIGYTAYELVEHVNDVDIYKLTRR